MSRKWSAFGWSLLALSASAQALAQAPGPSDAPPPGSVVVPAESGNVVVTPGTTTTTTTFQPVGTPSPGTDINAGLPSSSRPIVGDQRDTFDFGGNSGDPVVFGNKGAEGIVITDRARARVPDVHLVKRGDTLWELCDRYYGNPWQWPRVWSYNAQVANPHWIYPGDQLRMRDPRETRGASSTTIGGGGGDDGQSRLSGRNSLTSGTVLLRDQGFIGDPNKDTWGQVAGAVQEQMLLSQGNEIYVLLRQGAPAPKPGQDLTIYRSVRQPESVKGARKPPGEIVAVLGTVKVQSYDTKTRIARGVITESLDVVERGAKVGPVNRRFAVVPPKPSTANVKAYILTSFYPHVFLGQNQVVFIDRGSEDGLVAGNRLFVTRRGDTWREDLMSKSNRQRVRIDAAEPAESETTPLPGDSKNFPVETVAELRVLRVEKFSAVALVTDSRKELVPGDVAVTRVGQ